MRASRFVSRSLALAVFSSGAPTAAEEAPDEHRLAWPYRRFSTIEYGAAANVVVQLAFLEFRIEAETPNWEGGILFDDDARDVFLLDSAADKATFGTISDPMTLGLQVLPVALDTAVIPLLTDDWNMDVAWQMAMVDLQALSAVAFFNRFGHRVVKRARPSAEQCAQDPEFDELCRSGPFASFPSGHASGAFAGAGLSCAHHLHLPLYGGGAPDYILGCGVPMATAAVASTFRLWADRHYLSDVIVGAAVGFAGGFGMPTALHYAFEAEGTLRLQPAVTEQDALLMVSGDF